MSDWQTIIPNGWAECPIDDLFLSLEDGRTLHHGWSPQCETEPSLSEDEWGVLKTTAIQNGQFVPEHNKRLPNNLTPRPLLEVKRGDIVMTCAGPRARCGVPCLVRATRRRLMISGKMYRFRVPEEHIEPRYLEAFLLSNEAQAAIDRMKTGISDSGLNLTHDRFRQLRVRLAPLGEQRRIVGEIDKQFTRMAAAVAALKHVKANLKRYRAAVLKAACEGRLVPTEAELARREARTYEPASELLKRILAERRARWEAAQLEKLRAMGKGPVDDKWKLRYKKPEVANVSALPNLPEGWTWASVEEISTKVVDGVHKKPDYVESGIPFVTVRNLTAGPVISFERLSYVTPQDHALFTQRADPSKGDVLISKDGTLGVVRKVRTDEPFSIFVSVAMIKPVLYEMSDYLEVALSSPQVQAQMVPKGSGLQHIHLEDLRLDCVPLAPEDEQKRIVSEVGKQLSIIDEDNALLETNLKRAQRLRQAILKCAFEGKLARQDPSDEPATALLERIRAERAALLSVTRKPPVKRGKRESQHAS
jgi:type I restriction enzyme, S subunit